MAENKTRHVLRGRIFFQIWTVGDVGRKRVAKPPKDHVLTFVRKPLQWTSFARGPKCQQTAQHGATRVRKGSSSRGRLADQFWAVWGHVLNYFSALVRGPKFGRKTAPGPFIGRFSDLRPRSGGPLFHSSGNCNSDCLARPRGPPPSPPCFPRRPRGPHEDPRWAQTQNEYAQATQRS